MSRLSVRISDQLAAGIDGRAQRLGKTRSAVVRDALTSACLSPPADPPPIAEVLERAARLRARQPGTADVAALTRSVRAGSWPRLPLMRLTVPFN